MKIAIVGSRTITDIDLSKYIPKEATEIVSGGAKGVDTLAREFAQKNKLKLTEFLPEYEKYARAAPLKRNEMIVKYSDKVFVFWDTKSKGAKNVINNCEKFKVEFEVVEVE